MMMDMITDIKDNFKYFDKLIYFQKLNSDFKKKKYIKVKTVEIQHQIYREIL